MIGRIAKTIQFTSVKTTMRGAFYVTTALLITNSIRAAAESNQYEHQQTSHHDGEISDSMDTQSSPGRFLRDSREHHDNFTLNATAEERTPEASTRIIENSLTSLSEEALNTMRKAAHLNLDLNAPPKETSTGALEAYNLLRNKDLRTYTASNPGVPNSRSSKKRTAQALANPDKASGSAIPKKRPNRRFKKLRTSAPLKTTEAQSSIKSGEMTPTARIFGRRDIQVARNMYLEHLKRNSKDFKPTEDEMNILLRLVNRTRPSRPISNIYKPDLDNLMKMELEDLEQLFVDPKPVLNLSLEVLPGLRLEDQRNIKRCFYRLLRLKRWRHMYRDFFNFCLSNQSVCSNFFPQSTLEIELKMKKNVDAGVSVANPAVLGTKKTVLTEAEMNVVNDLKAAVEKANLSEPDKKAMYKKTIEGVYRDDDQLTSTDLSALNADALIIQTRKQRTALKHDVFKTPRKSDINEKPLPGGQDELSRDRKKIYEILKVAIKQVKKTNKRNDRTIYEDEMAQVTKIHETFIKESKLRYEPTLLVTKKMWKLFNWEEGSDPRTHTLAGHFFKDDVCLMSPEELEIGLGSDRVKELEKGAQKQPEADEEELLLELRTDYLLRLLETYDKFYPFCENNVALCELPSAELLRLKRTKITRARLRRKQRRVRNHQETS